MKLYVEFITQKAIEAEKDGNYDKDDKENDDKDEKT